MHINVKLSQFWLKTTLLDMTTLVSNESNVICYNARR